MGIIGNILKINIDCNLNLIYSYKYLELTIVYSY